MTESLILKRLTFTLFCWRQNIEMWLRSLTFVNNGSTFLSSLLIVLSKFFLAGWKVSARKPMVEVKDEYEIIDIVVKMPKVDRQCVCVWVCLFAAWLKKHKFKWVEILQTYLKYITHMWRSLDCAINFCYGTLCNTAFIDRKLRHCTDISYTSGVSRRKENVWSPSLKLGTVKHYFTWHIFSLLHSFSWLFYNSSLRSD